MRLMPVRGGLPRRGFAAIALFILAGAFALVAGLSFAEVSRLRFRALARESVERLGDFLGAKLSYRSASPSMLGALVVDELLVERADGSILLRAERAALGYELGALLAGRGVSALRRISLEGVSLDADLVADAPLVERLRRLMESGSGAAEGSAIERLELSARRISASISDGQGRRATLRGRVADLALEGERLDVALSGELEATAPELGRLSGASLRFALSGRSDAALTSARWEAELAASGDFGEVPRQRFAILLRGGALEARRLRDDVPLDLSLRVAADGTLAAEARFERFSPRRAFRPRSVPDWLLPWLRGSYRGSAVFASSAGFKEPRFSVSIEGSSADSGSAAPLALELDASGDTHEIALRRLYLLTGSASATLRGRFFPEALGLDLAIEAQGVLRAGASQLPFELGSRILGGSGEYFAFVPTASLAGSEFGDIALGARTTKDGAQFTMALSMPPSARLVAKAAGGDTEDAETAGSGAKDAGAAAEGASGGAEDAGAAAEDASGGAKDAGAAAEGAAPAGAGSGFSQGLASDGPGFEEGLASAEPGFELEGSVTWGEAPWLEARARLGALEADSFAPALRLLLGKSGAALLEGLVVAGSASLATDFERLSWSANDLVAVSPARDFSTRLAVSGGFDYVEIRSASVEASGYAASGTARLDYPEGRASSFRADFMLEDVPYALEGEIEGGGLDLRGDYGLSLRIRDSGEGVDARLTAEALPLPFDFGTLVLSLDARGRFLQARDWWAEVLAFRLEPSGDAVASLPTTTLSAFVNQDGGSVDGIQVSDRHSTLRGGATLTWSLQPEPGLRLEFSLDDGALEAYRFEGSWDGEVLGGALTFTASPLARVPGAKLSGAASGRLGLAGSPSRLAVEGEVSVPSGRHRDSAFSLSAQGSWFDGRLALREVSGSYATQSVEGLTLIADMKARTASVEGAWRMGSGLRAGVEARLRASGEGEGFLGGAMSIEGTLSELAIGEARVDRWAFSAEGDADGWVLRGGEGELMVRTLNDGAFSAIASAPLPVRFIALGRISGSNLVVDVENLSGEVDALFGLARISAVDLMGGRFSGRLRIEGPLSDPDFFGSLAVEDLRVSVPDYTPVVVGPVSTVVDFDGKRASLIQPRAEAEGAFVYVRAAAALSSWSIDSLSLRVVTIEETLVPIDATVVGVSASGSAGIDLSIDIWSGNIRLAGLLGIPVATVVIDPSVLSAGAPRSDSGGGPGRPKTDLNVELDIRLGKGVKVYFPSKAFPVIAGQADPSSALKLSYDSASSRLRMRGIAELRGGDLFYIQRNFYLKKASIVFNETETKFDPLATLEAELRTRDALGPVRVTLRATDSRLSALDIRMESVPARSQAEIAALLGQGLLGADEAGALDIREAVIAGTQAIPQLDVVTYFEENVRELLGFDLFYLKTEAVQRLLLDLSLPEPEGDQAKTLSDYLQGTAVFAGKYIGDSVFFEAALSLQTEPLAGADVLTVDSEFGLEWDTPFFLLDWRLSPKHPEDLYLSDSSFTFSWRLSY